MVRTSKNVHPDVSLTRRMQAMNLTNQVRSIAGVTKAVAQGDLSKKIEVNVRGEILELKVERCALIPEFHLHSLYYSRKQ